ncbi:MAG: MFS transporter, partial [Pseudomonadales bacterium]
RVSQVAVVGAFLGGFVTGGFWSLGPIIAKAHRLAPEQIGIFMAVTILGGATFQLPVGRLSDRFDRRLVILLVALLGLGVCVSATLLGHTSVTILYLLMFVFGGMTFPLYALCLAHANDNTNLGLMEVASVILLMSSAGAVLGPMVVAYTLEFSTYAIFMVSGVALGILAIWTALRIQIHKVARTFFMPFVNISRTTQGIVDLVPEEDVPDTPPTA